MPMTKSELISRLAARYPQLVAKDAELAVKVILDAMAKSLSEGQRIEIRGFGSFDLNYRPPRVGRNPKSGSGWITKAENYKLMDIKWRQIERLCRFFMYSAL